MSFGSTVFGLLGMLCMALAVAGVLFDVPTSSVAFPVVASLISFVMCLVLEKE